MHQLVYAKLARSIKAKENCVESGNEEWYDKHNHVIDYIENKILPHGSGIDNGCTINRKKYETLEITSSFHTMDEHGSYDKWIDFKVKVKPSLQFGYDLKITGNFGKYQDLRDCLYETFDSVLSRTFSNHEIKEMEEVRDK